MKKILYILHISWDWIFQRPQILALMLENDYMVDVLQLPSLTEINSDKQKRQPINLHTIVQIPGARSKPFLGALSKAYTSLLTKKLLNVEYVWICHPQQYALIPSNFNGKIIYDCMDNYAELDKGYRADQAKKNEQLLIERANVIFASSLKLYEKINRPEKTVLLRNGFMIDDRLVCVQEPQVKEKYIIGYIGTVSAWFDTELLCNSLTDNIEYHIIGPVNSSVKDKFVGDNIVLEGVVKHELLSEKVANYDALIMPFCINEIVLSVDPVKLYEYISFGKCIISVWYPEIDRFEPFVYFYKTREEYEQLLIDLSQKGFPAKYSDSERMEFLKENSWEYRYKIVLNKLQELV